MPVFKGFTGNVFRRDVCRNWVLLTKSLTCTSQLIPLSVSRFCLLFAALLLFGLPGISQQGGRIVYTDSSFADISGFRELRSEFYYYDPADRQASDNCSIMDFLPGGSKEKVRSIRFLYEKGVGTGKFCYEFHIEATTNEGKPYSRRFKAWDWMEMTLPDNGSGRNTEITFFTEDKKLDIARIDLQP